MYSNPTSKERRLRRKKGKCPECGGERDSNKITCKKCLTTRKMRIAKLALKDKCRCGKIIKDNKSRCRECLAKLTKRRKSRRKFRSCPDCGKMMEFRQIKRCKDCTKKIVKENIKKRAKKWALEGKCTNCGRLKKHKDKNLAWCSSCRETNSLIGRIRRAKAAKRKKLTPKKRKHN